jgi:acetolactate synthase-1/2/3 large subunit
LLNAPVITTPEGKGAIAGDHPLSLGVFYSGYGPVRWTFPQADVILAVGSRLYFTARAPVSIREDQRLIHIDVDPAEIGRNQTTHLGITSDARAALELILEALPEEGQSRWRSEELEQIKDKVRAQLEEVAPLQLSLIRTIREELATDDILIPGVNNVAYWGHLSYPVLKPRTYLNSAYFATLGYALPTALGAKIGHPDKHVVAICGDGGFMYSLADLATSVQEKANVVAIVFVDKAFGASLRDQRLRFEGRIVGTQFRDLDLTGVASALGARGMKLTGPDELGGALRKALDADVTTVIEVPVPTMATPFW